MPNAYAYAGARFDDLDAEDRAIVRRFLREGRLILIDDILYHNADFKE
jgi:hypothetical protein